MRAAGRAIMLLTDEVEQLYVDLWHARDSGAAAPEAAPPAPEAADVPATLRSRIRRLRLQRSD